MKDSNQRLPMIAALTASIALCGGVTNVYAEQTAPGSNILIQDASALLRHHNQERAAVSVPALNWSSQLSNFAQQWANQLARSGCQMRHRQDSQYGENLYIGTARAYRSLDASIAWAQEKTSYRGGPLRPSNWYASGHYTQMVWRETQQIGCGEALCSGNRIVVCNYSPAGNVMGYAPY